MHKSYGVLRQRAGATVVERACEEIAARGFTILPAALEEVAVRDARTALDRVYDCQVRELAGREQLVAIDDTDIVRAPLTYELRFLSWAMCPDVLEVVRAVIGDYVVLQQQNGVINRPKGTFYQTAWHRDLPYQHFVASPPLAVSALICIDDFTAETGGTVVLPGSHLFRECPSSHFMEAHELQVEAVAGDVLVFDSMLYHRSGVNRSQQMRRGLNHVYSAPIVRPAISLPRAIGDRAPMNAEVRRFLGYEIEPPETALAWRQARLARKQDTPR